MLYNYKKAMNNEKTFSIKKKEDLGTLKPKKHLNKDETANI